MSDDGTTATATPATEPDASVPAPQYPTYDSGPTDTPDTGSSSESDSGSSNAPADSGSSQPPHDSGSSQPPHDAGTSTQDSGSTTSSAACDLSSPVKAVLYELELSQIAHPTTCPCGAGECCYLLYCVPE